MTPVNREDLIVLMEAGYVSLGMGRQEDARTIFEGVVVLAPDSEIPHVALGSTYFAQKKYDQAIRSYRRALQIRSDSPFARAYLGEALFFRGKKEEATAELDKALLLDPGGKCGDFARALLDAIKKGFTPPGMVVKH